jgi:hypothetical protein
LPRSQLRSALRCAPGTPGHPTRVAAAVRIANKQQATSNKQQATSAKRCAVCWLLTPPCEALCGSVLHISHLSISDRITSRRVTGPSSKLGPSVLGGLGGQKCGLGGGRCRCGLGGSGCRCGLGGSGRGSRRGSGCRCGLCGCRCRSGSKWNQSRCRSGCRRTRRSASSVSSCGRGGGSTL